MSTISIKPLITAMPDSSVRRDGWLRFADDLKSVHCGFELDARDMTELREQVLQLVQGPAQVKPNPIGDRKASPRDHHSRIRVLVWNDRHDELHVRIGKSSVTVTGITPDDVLECLDQFGAEVEDAEQEGQ